MRAWVFPGQGSQAAGMGEGLFERFPEILAIADEILGYSVAELCLHTPLQRLSQTQHTQPALYVVNALMDLSRRDAGAPPPDFVAGHSLGEYNALLAADVFDFATGLRLVKTRGELMSQASGGGMAAVLGLDADKVEEALRSHGLLSLDVANYNSPLQVVLAGPAADIARAEDIFCDLGATYSPLNVSAAFHSRSMEPLVQRLDEALEGVAFRPPKIPVVSSVTAAPCSADEVRENLRKQIREPVRWTETVRYLLAAGDEDFEEVGPGQVLTKLIRRIRESPEPAPEDDGTDGRATAESLGAASFRRDHGVRRAYVAGAMGYGISSPDLVIRMAQAGYLSIFGAHGLPLARIEEDLRRIRTSLDDGASWGVNLVASPDDPEAEEAVVELCLRHGVRCLEAAGYITLSPALVRYRLKGLSLDGQGRLVRAHKVIAKVSRPDAADAFLQPAPEAIVAELLRTGLITGEEARLARRVPMADDLCAEAGSGWRTDPGATAVLLPALIRRRDEALRRGGEAEVRVGSSGGIGTPEAAAAAFLLGADFILTGSINQCTVEAATSEEVKDLLQTLSVQDTESAPADDLFELGGRVQVVKRGVLFPARANRLHDLWRHHGSWEEIDAATRARIERDYLRRSFESVSEAPGSAECDGREKMARVFRWYLDQAARLALSGARGQKGNFQIFCGPALGAFNQWVKGTDLESWRHRHVDLIADEIMAGAAGFLNRQLRRLTRQGDRFSEEGRQLAVQAEQVGVGVHRVVDE